MRIVKFAGIVLVLLQLILFSNLAGLPSGKIFFGLSGQYEKNDEIYLHLNFSEPIISEDGKRINVMVKEASSYLNENGAPYLPVYKKTFIFPAGTKIKEVRCTPHKLHEIEVNGKISPAVGYFPLNKKNIEVDFDKNVYNSLNFYPENWFIYNIGVGLYEGEHVIFLSMEIYPVRYSPLKNVIGYAENFEIRVKKEEGRVLNFNDFYDLLVIAPDKFSDELERLVSHKELHGIKTKLITTEEIYSNYNGRDEPEKIKYAIKDAIEQWGIKYVLLVGGMKGQRFKWYVPVRYTNLDDNSSWETGYISDLYYADIYKYEDGKIVFEDWDSNGNGKYAEWNKMNKDVLDLYPDVYVGRIPCRNKWEVKVMVDKIIEYETSTQGQSWFRRMVVIGGDSFPDKEVGTDYIEGQVECDYALSFMDGFEHIRIYVEGGDYEFTPENAEEIISQGEGFLYFSGHGNPASWATHPHNDFNTWIDFGLKNILNLKNGNKLPVCIVGGCHNNQFNVSIFRIFKEGIWAYYLGEMSPECWGWLFTRNSRGGSIATIGNTGLGYGTIGDGPVDEIPDSEPDGIPDCIQYLGGWLEPHFFEVYNKKGKDILGETWGTAITDYINNFPIDWSKEWIGERPYTVELVDCKTVQEWVLLGDPSLKIGGY